MCSGGSSFLTARKAQFDWSSTLKVCHDDVLATEWFLVDPR